MRNILIMMAVIFSLTQLTFAKEWNGIKPLLTTRVEVIKLLGDPLPRLRYSLIKGERFEFDGQFVYIRWAIADCREEKILDDSPPADLNVVVHQITVILQAPLALADIEKLDLPGKNSALPGFSASRKLHCDGSGDIWSCSPMNIETGFGYTIRTDKKTISRLYYFPSDQEQLLRKEKLPLCSGEMK